MQRPPPLNHYVSDGPERQHDTDEIESEHKVLLLRNLLWVACPIFIFFALNHYLHHHTILFSLCTFFTLLVCLLILYTHLSKTRFRLMWALRVFVLLLAVLFLFYIARGNEHHGLALWSYAYPLVAFFLLGKKEGMVWAGSFMLLLGLLLFTPDLDLLVMEYTMGFKFRLMVSLVLVGIMAYLFEASRQRALAAMQSHQSELKASEKRARLAYDELKVAQSQLVQSGKLASIGELAAGVAHELNQPLMVIRGNAQLMQRQLNRSAFSEDDLVTLLKTIERNTKRMIVIINHLRSFSRQSDKQLQPVDIHQVIDDAFLMIGEQLRLRGIKVKQHRGHRSAIVPGDRHQLEQVFLNLLSNAKDALAIHTATARYRQTEKCITITTREAQEQGMLEVLFQDNGGGIIARDLDTIFDPFFTTKEVGRGTGLGLSISYSIIQKHNGQIKVADTGPRGTTFQLLLPVFKFQQDSEASTPQATADVAGTNCSIPRTT